MSGAAMGRRRGPPGGRGRQEADMAGWGRCSAVNESGAQCVLPAGHPGQHQLAAAPPPAPAPLAPAPTGAKATRIGRRGKVAVGVVVAVLVLAAVGSAGKPGGTASPSATPGVSQEAAAAATTLPADTPVPTDTPAATETTAPSVAAALSPETAQAAIVAQQGLEDHVDSNWDALAVSVPQPAEVDVSVKPALPYPEYEMVGFAGGDALVAAKALFAAFKSVQLIRVTVMAGYQDNNGNTTTLVNAELDVTRARAASFNYAGLSKMDPLEWLCGAGHYFVHPGDWNGIAPSDRGCMKANTNPG